MEHKLLEPPPSLAAQIATQERRLADGAEALANLKERRGALLVAALRGDSAADQEAKELAGHIVAGEATLGDLREILARLRAAQTEERVAQAKTAAAANVIRTGDLARQHLEMVARLDRETKALGDSIREAIALGHELAEAISTPESRKMFAARVMVDRLRAGLFKHFLIDPARHGQIPNNMIFEIQPPPNAPALMAAERKVLDYLVPIWADREEAETVAARRRARDNEKKARVVATESGFAVISS
jgi:hypothetical protein